MSGDTRKVPDSMAFPWRPSSFCYVGRMNPPPPASSASTSEQPTARMTSGSVRGVRVRGAASFRGIPYAADPVGEYRFAPPQPVAGLGGRDLSGVAPSPAVPQPPSRMEALMGRPGGTYDESGSLTLNIWAPPSAASDANLPVLFWLHGGALMSGSASWSWYDGARLASEQNIVVVTANYRLGALGYLDVSTLDPTGNPGHNRGFLDQATALEWVSTHIAAFGGDAAKITVGGQSSGAEAAALLTGSPRTRHLVRRLLLQSGGGHGLLQTSEQAADVANEFLDTVSLRTGGPRPDLAQLRAMPISELLDAQVELVRRRTARGETNPPFGIVDDGPQGILPTGGTRAFLADRYRLDLMAGWTRDELQGMSRLNPAAEEMDEEAARSVLKRHYGTQADALLAQYRAHRHAATPCDLVAAISGDAVMMAPLLDLAQERAFQDAASYLYRFDWSANKYGACHCIDLPFTFGTFDSWTDAAMLQGADRGEMEALSASLRSAIGSFVRTGRPADSDSSWAPWSAGASVARIGGPMIVVETGLGLAERDHLRAAGRTGALDH